MKRCGRRQRLIRAIVDERTSACIRCGRRRRAHGAQTLERHARACSTTPARLRRLLRGDLDTIVAKALKKNADERYPSVTALADDLRRYLRHEPISARPASISYRTVTLFVATSPECRPPSPSSC